MKTKKDNKLLKGLLIFIVVSIIVNVFMAFIAKVFNISFFVSNELGTGPYIFYTFNISYFKINITQTIVNTWVIMLVITLILYFGTKKLSVDNPTKRQVIFEALYEFIENTFLNSFGKYKKRYMPFFTALFLLISFANLSFFLFPFVPIFVREDGALKVEPFFRTFTADINTNVALALLVTILFVGVLIRRVGITGYLKELSKPFVVMLPINFMGELAKPINITIRLFGNMVAGLVILGMIYGLNIPHLLEKVTGGYLTGPFSLALLWPIFIQLYLDVFVGILQAFVFTVLSSVYIGQSLGSEEI